MSIDLMSFFMGKQTSRDVTLENGDYTFSDDGEGNVTMTKTTEGGENGNETT